MTTGYLRRLDVAELLALHMRQVEQEGILADEPSAKEELRP